MENILILDTETTGLSPETSQIIEVGCILYNVPTRSIISEASCLFYAEENPAFAVNRISLDTLNILPKDIEVNSLGLMAIMIDSCDAIIAHNAQFDKGFIDRFSLGLFTKNKQWICTKNDVIWPLRKGVSLSLISICSELGVPIVSTHRALSDCHLLLSAIECMEDIEYFLDKSGKGRLTYHAQISYEQRQLVKDEGFQWDNVKKVWFAKLNKEQAASMPFTVYPAESLIV
jgi:DNA polymerase-3 subunit epsilon